MVEVLDADTNQVLDTRPIELGFSFTYRIWNLKGRLILHAVNKGSTEAAGGCIGGLFVVPAGK